MENPDDLQDDLDHSPSHRWAPLWRRYLSEVPTALLEQHRLAEPDIHPYSFDLLQASSDIERDLQAWMEALPSALRPGDEVPTEVER